LSDRPTVELENCKQRRLTERARYIQTVLLTLGVKHYLENHAKQCRFLSAEPIFRTDKDSEIQPDMVLQYDSSSGALCEIKTSFPFQDSQLLETLKQLEKYGQTVIGWGTSDGTVRYHDVILFCDILDISKVLSKIREWLDNGQLKISENLVVCEWGIVQSPKMGDTLLIRKRLGDVRCKELSSLLNEDLEIDLQTLTVAYEKCRFTRKEPPVEYTMEQVWLYIFTKMTEKFETFETSIRATLDVAYDYYIPWSNIKGEYSQIRERWIKKAMKAFCDINLAEQDLNDQNKYKVFREKEIGKDFLSYIIERLCRKAEMSKLKQTTELDKEQKTIGDFQPSS
jgi:hypothetical protein